MMVCDYGRTMHTALRTTVSLVLKLSLLVGVLLVTQQVHARGYDGRESSFTIAFDFDYSAALSNRLIKSGGGGAMRLGHVMEYNMVTIIPELTLEYHTFGGEYLGQSTLMAGKVGSRFRFLTAVEPGAFIHIGGGSLDGPTRYSHGGPIFDIGFSLDFTFITMVDFGFHVAWNRIFGGYDEGVSYTVAGFNLGLIF